MARPLKWIALCLLLLSSAIHAVPCNNDPSGSLCQVPDEASCCPELCSPDGDPGDPYSAPGPFCTLCECGGGGGDPATEAPVEDSGDTLSPTSEENPTLSPTIVTSEPTTSPVTTSKPTGSPVTSKPTGSPVTSKPTGSPATSEPTVFPLTNTPTQSPAGASFTTGSLIFRQVSKGNVSTCSVLPDNFTFPQAACCTHKWIVTRYGSEYDYIAPFVMRPEASDECLQTYNCTLALNGTDDSDGDTFDRMTQSDFIGYNVEYVEFDLRIFKLNFLDKDAIAKCIIEYTVEGSIFWAAGTSMLEGLSMVQATLIAVVTIYATLAV